MSWFYTAHVLWFIAGALLVLAELAMPGFVMLFFALGAFIASLAAYLGLGTSGQIVVFIAASMLGVALLRRMFLRIFHGRTHSPAPGEGGPASADKDDEDIGLGKTAEVTRAIGPNLPGEIKFRGSYWRAQAETDIGEGEIVVITGLAQNDSGAYLVRPAKEA